MTKDEALKLALGYVERNCPALVFGEIKEALAQPEQEPTCPECKAAVLYECVACSSNNYPPAAQLEQEMEQPEIFCGVDYADGVLAVSVMRRRPDDVAELLHMEQIELAQPEERNFCPRCGKRTADLTTIHTCTPPRENT